MPQPTIHQVEWHFDDTGLTVLAYGLGPDGTALQAADLTSITMEVRERDGTVTLSPATLTIADVIEDTPVTNDPRWSGSVATGYNFIVVVPSSAFPEPDKTYRVSFLFDPSAAGEQNFGLAINVPTKSLKNVN